MRIIITYSSVSPRIGCRRDVRSNQTHILNLYTTCLKCRISNWIWAIFINSLPTADTPNFPYSVILKEIYYNNWVLTSLPLVVDSSRVVKMTVLWSIGWCSTSNAATQDLSRVLNAVFSYRLRNTESNFGAICIPKCTEFSHSSQCLTFPRLWIPQTTILSSTFLTLTQHITGAILAFRQWRVHYVIIFMHSTNISLLFK